MEQATPTITDTGFNDVLVGTEMFDILAIEPVDLLSPANTSKIQDIAKFVNQFQDGPALIRNAMHKKPADIGQIDHAFRYITLQKKRFELGDQLKGVEQELAFYE